MAKSFFSCDQGDAESLFEGLEIMRHKDIVENHFKKYPVIYLDLDIKGALTTVAAAISKYESALYKAHEEHLYLIKNQPELYQKVLNGQEQWKLGASFSASLDLLATILFRYHQKQVIILVDGYDTMVSRIASSTFATLRKRDSGEFNEAYSKVKDVAEEIFGALDRAIKGECVRFAVLTGVSNISRTISSELEKKQRLNYLVN